MNLQEFRKAALEGRLPDRDVLRKELGLPLREPIVTITAAPAEKAGVVRSEANARQIPVEQVRMSEWEARRRVEIAKAELLLSVEPISEELKAIISLILRWELDKVQR